ncbi:potassium voltage-gated channel subfamily E member 4 [Chiloscyllium plagiosum]|uniref:potassium voltage-gated channel subfamily E member 4 n=1 Tax=Chiloscyllium plagiosum TaxID=36176 RepID=UPI001CB84FB6|nr:potassium voltage-gated channel subfamily E member 4 [Chiloscyllium plagiosum]XP_043557996.1 potassium voltage-gated channel subfamily E member 4 [Chiloscyllium plagiosum]XP_043557997.1 potassium voltage-gated channel subfamily E member 4 [Chiloscyllium plagiosum]XP_043557998.1 potassium voltage-gated channel subfamily E member 4 [Chiloscyllium plagiosum]XP_043557999.1 potassium voltage-gated channel subfamily E member 4 [Chiloscyllium plagiosum]XP_043558000.1 potassium voltage-gated channe
MMDHSNETTTASRTAKIASDSEDNEYLYILIVMSFYGVFLLGIVLGYIKSKRQERKDGRLFLYDDRGEWAGLKAVHMPLVFSALPESVVPALTCAMCTMESSVSSETAQEDIQVTIPEEVGATESLLSDFSTSTERNPQPPTESPCSNFLNGMA